MVITKIVDSFINTRQAFNSIDKILSTNRTMKLVYKIFNMYFIVILI